jgi:uncharacterized membrane protein YgaE (UPF0421/DUF939 family)
LRRLGLQQLKYLHQRQEHQHKQLCLLLMRLLNRVPMLTDWIRQRQFQRQRESRRQRESHAKREKFSQVVIQHLKMPMYLLRQKFFQSLAAPLLALPQFLRRRACWPCSNC